MSLIETLGNLEEREDVWVSSNCARLGETFAQKFGCSLRLFFPVLTLLHIELHTLSPSASHDAEE